MLHRRSGYAAADSGRRGGSGSTAKTRPRSTWRSCSAWTTAPRASTAPPPLRILAHSPRPALENLGLSLTRQGDLVDY